MRLGVRKMEVSNTGGENSSPGIRNQMEFESELSKVTDISSF